MTTEFLHGQIRMVKERHPEAPRSAIDGYMFLLRLVRDRDSFRS